MRDIYRGEAIARASISIVTMALAARPVRRAVLAIASPLQRLSTRRIKLAILHTPFIDRRYHLQVALLHYSVPPVVGVVESVLAHHARLLHEAGHTVQLFAARGAGGHLNSYSRRVLGAHRVKYCGTCDPTTIGDAPQIGCADYKSHESLPSLHQ
jgi:hypothetical protein